LIAGDSLRLAARNAVAAFVAAMDRWRMQAERMSHTDLVQIVLDESGYTAMWQADRSADAAGRLENLKELVVAMAEFENLGGFLEHVSLVMDNAAEAGGDMVNLMTLHSAKGLEFDTVFLPGWEEGLFPNQRAMEENGLAALEEERRLAYVGLTRARHRAYVSFAANRRIHGQWQYTVRSRFVEELPLDHVEIVAELGLQPGASWDSGWPNAVEVPAAPRSSAAPRRLPLSVSSAPVPRRGEEVPRVGGFAVGGRVFHQKFGYGTITQVEDNKLSINFDVAGAKKVMDAFVEHA
jgi:DNA helicase-2/ATP-dependent DNA helicase PcrA